VREETLLRDLLRGAAVVLGTPVGLAGGGVLRHVGRDWFDVAVLDEAGQVRVTLCFGRALV
jgi:hypothetical protein